jgi:hypothetical protein
MLACRKREQGDVNWICLYTDYSADAERLMANGEDESVSYDSLTMYTCTGESASLAVGDPQPDANSNSWLQGLAKFFEDQWSGVVGMMSHPPTDAPPASTAPKASRKKTPWLPHDRKIMMNGKVVLLLALLWCTTQEQLLFSKFPEVCGHDTKAQVCSTEERRMGPRRGAKSMSVSRAKKLEAAAPKSFKRTKLGTGSGVTADPVTICSESSTAASSCDDSSSFAGFHYSDNYSSEDPSSDDT